MKICEICGKIIYEKIYPFILPDLNAGGAERIVTTIYQSFAKKNFLSSILLLRKEGLYLDFLQNDVEIIDIKTPRIRHALKPILQQIRKESQTSFSIGFGEVNAYFITIHQTFPENKIHCQRNQCCFSTCYQKRNPIFFINFTIITIKSFAKVMIWWMICGEF